MYLIYSKIAANPKNLGILYQALSTLLGRGLGTRLTRYQLTVLPLTIWQLHVDIPGRVGHYNGELAEAGHVEGTEVAVYPLGRCHLVRTLVEGDKGKEE